MASHLHPSRFKILTPAAALLLALTGCGGGGGGEEADTPDEPSVATEEATSSGSSQAGGYSSKAGSSRAALPARWFYDINAAGTPRVLRNDLSGDLSAEVQLVQSHSMAPAGNDAREMPTPVALREALLLVLGNGKLMAANPATDHLIVVGTYGGQPLGLLSMAAPAQLPASDNGAAETGTRGDVGYSKKAWSVRLPWNWMRPGLQLTFELVQNGRSTRGVLAADKIQMAAPTEVVLQNIRVGMLTPPNSNTGFMLQNPEAAGTDYFQTLPIAKLTVASYQDVKLDRVIVSTGGGTIYDASAPDPQQGGVYTGDMRQDVAKVQVAQGINLANSGLIDSPMDETQPESFNEHVLHHARGLYSNGIQDHGLSGGNGMITLLESRGNELSHELGHSFSLGHYPGEAENVKNPVHHADSGWGFIASRNRMRGNLAWDTPFNPAGTVNYKGNFAGIFNYTADAMSGGNNDSAISKYTHYTGYSARRIQSYLNTARTGGPRAIPDAQYASGWRTWNTSTGLWVDRNSVQPAFSAPKPVAVGVPVVTFIGGYQTNVRKLNLLYPPMVGNWGVTYNPPPTPRSLAAGCWLEVTLADSKTLTFPLESSAGAAPPRKFHVNVAQSRQPRSAAITCRGEDGVVSALSQQTVSLGTAAPVPAVVIGEEAGLSALRRVELAELDALLKVRPFGNGLDSAQQEKLLAWRSDLSPLSLASFEWATRWLALYDISIRVNGFVQSHPELAAPRAAGNTVQQFITMAAELEQGDTGALPYVATLLRQPYAAPMTLLAGQACLAIDDAALSAPRLSTMPPTACLQYTTQRWWMDIGGRVHNAARPDLCLATDGGWYSPITLNKCSLQAKGQSFVQRPSGRVEALQYANRSIEAGAAVQIANNEEGASRAWSAIPVQPSTLWTLLSPNTMLALSRYYPQWADPIRAPR